MNNSTFDDTFNIDASFHATVIDHIGSIHDHKNPTISDAGLQYVNPPD